MTLLSLFFFGKVGIHRCIKSAKPIPVLIKRRCLFVISGLPLMLAIFIASSRVHDDMHHPADVVAGAIIGMSCAIFGHGLW
jgi:membrane-associated phospholipid phosphatase